MPPCGVPKELLATSLPQNLRFPVEVNQRINYGTKADEFKNEDMIAQACKMG